MDIAIALSIRQQPTYISTGLYPDVVTLNEGLTLGGSGFLSFRTLLDGRLTEFSMGANFQTDSRTAGTVDELGFNIGSAYIVPIPPALWLFGSGLIGLIGFARRKA